MVAFVARELRRKESKAAKGRGGPVGLCVREVADLFPGLSESVIRARVKERLPDVESQRVRAWPLRFTPSPLCCAMVWAGQGEQGHDIPRASSMRASRNACPTSNPSTHAPRPFTTPC